MSVEEGERVRSTQAAERRGDQLRRLAASALLINSTVEIDELLAVITAQARETIGAHQALISLTADDGSQAVASVAATEKHAAWRESAHALAAGELVDHVCRENRPYRLGRNRPDGLDGWLAAPLVSRDGRNLGVIQLADKEDGEFDGEDEAILVQLAQMASAALENARLYDDARRRADELDALHRLAEAVAAAGDLDQVFDVALDALEQALGVDRGSVVLFERGGVIHFRAWRNLSDAYREAVEGSAPWKGHADDPSAFVVDDVLTDAEVAELHEVFRAEGIRSMALVPLVHAGVIRGRFVLYADRPAAFAPQDVRLASSMASHVAAAVERRRVVDELVESRNQLAAIFSSVADGITAQDPLGRIVFANDAAAQLSGFGTAEELLAAEPSEIVSRFEIFDEQGDPLPFDQLPGRVALATGREAEQVLVYRMRGSGDRRWSIVRATPLLDAGGRVELAINVFHDITEPKEAEQRLRFLSEASEALAGSLEMDDALASVARLAVPALADYCLIDLLDERGKLGRVFIEHADEQGAAVLHELRERFPPVFNEAHPATRAVATGEPVLYEDVTRDALAEAALADEHLELYLQLDPRSYLVVPFVAHGRVLGTIALGTSGRSDRHYSGEDVRLAREVAERSAVALENALLHRAARESLAQLEAVLVSAPVGIGFWDRDLRYVRVNDALADINRLSPAEHVGRTLADVVPELADALEPLYRRVLETGEPVVHEESTNLDASALGGERHWLSSYFPVRARDGETIGVAAVILEVTERERALQRAGFLARASEILASSLVVSDVVPAIAALAAETFCDSCTVWSLENGSLVRIARANASAERDAAFAASDRYDVAADEGVPLVQVARTGEPYHAAVLDDAELRRFARSPAELESLATSVPRSMMILPLVVRGALRGAVSLASASAGRHDDADFAAAEELARRIAVALDQADLHAEVRETAGLLQGVLTQMPSGLAIASADGRLLLRNEQAEAIWRRPWTETTLAELGELSRGFHSDGRPFEPHEWPLARAVESGEVVSAEEIEIERGDGSRGVIEVSAAPVRDEHGQIVAGVVTFDDVTARHEADARLRESEERFRRLANTIPALVWMSDTTGGCTYFNRRWLEFTGRPLEQELGFGWYDNVHPEDAERVRQIDGRATEERSAFSMEYRLAHRDGGYRWVLDEGVPRLTPAGEFAGHIGACIDIEARKLAEERQHFLSDVSAVLASSLDVTSMLGAVTRRAVPQLADWCTVVLSLDGGTLETVAVAHADPEQDERVRQTQEAALADADAATAVVAVIRSGEARLTHDTPDARSELVVPLTTRERSIGAMTFATARDSGRRLVDDDVELAQLVARRAAVAVDNALLYAEAEFQRALLERQGEASIDGLLVVGADGSILSVNERFREIWQIPDEAIAQGDAAALEASRARVEDPDAFIARVRELYERREASRDDLRFRDGRTIERYGSPVLGPDGAYLGYLWSFRDITDRIEVAQRLREAQTQLRSAISAAAIGTWSWDIAHDRLAADEFVAHLFAVDPVLAAAGLPLDMYLAAVHPDDLPAVREAIRRTTEHGEELSVDFRARDAEGLLRWVHARGRVETGPDGAPARVAGGAAEITERRLAAERLEFLARASDVLATTLDYHETLRRVAEIAVPMLGDACFFDLENEDTGELERVATAHVSVEPPAERPADAHPISAAIRTGKPVLEPAVAERRPAGAPSVLSVPVLVGKRAIGALTFVFDAASRRHRIEDQTLGVELARRAALAVETARLYAETEARAHAAQALEFVRDGVFLVDAEGRIALWNPAAAAITGIPGEGVLGRAADEALAGWPLERAGDRTETYPVEIDGRELWLSLSAVPFEEGTVYAFRDLTEEYAVERLKSDFVSTVSHELRTPLAAIYGAAMTLQRTDVALAEDQRVGLLGVVANESERLARIVNDVLWASRLDSGVLAVSIESCDPAALATAVVTAARVHVPGNVDLALTLEPDPPAVAADPDKVRQVLVNLVDNAIKYSPDGGLVEVRVESNEHAVRFSVRDRGLGIPTSEQERIFEKFFRLDPNLTRGVGGTGLGLYICRELVRRMDGRIWVDSSEGAGSTFAFELPIAR